MERPLVRPLSRRNDCRLLTLVTFAGAALAVLSGCGGSANAKGAPPQSDGGPGGSGVGSSCDPLETAAGQAFGTFVGQHATCAADSDCTLVHFTPASYCASPCPQVMNQTGAASAVSVASQDCAQFNAAGCTPPEIGCPGFGSPICAAGACALYKLELTESGTFTHGTCTALTETYEESWVQSPAPRDFALTLTTTNGSFYADGACTTPLSSGAITLTKGAPSVTFGFLPAGVGAFSVTIDDGSGSPGGISGIAQ
jgi:hypothetical protein